MSLITIPEATAARHEYKRQAGKSWSDRFAELAGQKGIGKSYALVLAVGNYKAGGPWRNLRSPAADALRMHKFLVEAGFDEVFTLTDDNATKASIEHYMVDVLPDRLKAEDRFLFYFSGHGTQRTLQNGTLEGYLPLANSGRSTWSTMISMKEIERWYDRLRHARHLLFVLDSCFSGLAGVESKGGAQQIYLDVLLRRSHLLLTAGSAGQVSVGDLDRWHGSLFTDALLRGARGEADASFGADPPDGVVSVSELFTFIQREIASERSRDPTIVQEPLRSDLLGISEGEFFFLSGKQPAQSRRVSSGVGAAERKDEIAEPSHQSLVTGSASQAGMGVMASRQDLIEKVAKGEVSPADLQLEFAESNPFASSYGFAEREPIFAKLVRFRQGLAELNDAMIAYAQFLVRVAGGGQGGDILPTSAQFDKMARNLNTTAGTAASALGVKIGPDQQPLLSTAAVQLFKAYIEKKQHTDLAAAIEEVQPRIDEFSRVGQEAVRFLASMVQTDYYTKILPLATANPPDAALILNLNDTTQSTLATLKTLSSSYDVMRDAHRDLRAATSDPSGLVALTDEASRFQGFVNQLAKATAAVAAAIE